MEMHRWDEDTETLASAIVRYAENRIAHPQPLDGTTPSTEELDRRAGATITPEGLGGFEALRVWSDLLAPATLSTDHPANLAFVPGAPSKASVLFDLVVGASSIIGAGWLDGAGAIWAENQALRWIADLAGMPVGAGGVFVSGGSAGNLSGLVAARHTAAERLGHRPERWTVVCSSDAHSSIKGAARVMDVDVLPVPHDGSGRMTAGLLSETLGSTDLESVFAVVATGGTTNTGIVDDLAGIAEVCGDRGVWLHVDAAYGGGALCAPSVRHRFDGIEHADSLIVDPHKWLYAPYDCCALLYRDPALAERTFTQEAEYLEDVNAWEAGEWSPAHYAHHLSRRVRGLPLWFSLATHGTDAYRDSVEQTLALTRETADEIRRRDGLELILEPDLSVVLFRRVGWSGEDYLRMCRDLMRGQVAFVMPTSWEGEKVMRFCFINPRTTMDHVRPILDAMA
jgi:glutamate/tyrosine decarboxylase-like PLP-dependent enzyme